jgi:hypothetical protein
MAKHNRRSSVSYLTSEGTLFTIFEETRNGVKIGETADVIYNYAKVGIYQQETDRTTNVPGRIVIHDFRYPKDGFVPLAKGGRVEAHLPSVQAGSDNTKRHGFEVQYVKLTTKGGLVLSWTDVTSIISSSFTVQAGSQYAVKDGLRQGDLLWSGVTVNKVTDLQKVKQEEEVTV